MSMQQCANQKFALESQCITISRQIRSTAPQNNFPPATVYRHHQGPKLTPLPNTFQSKPAFPKLQFRVKKRGKGRFRNAYAVLQRSHYKPSPALSHQCSASISQQGSNICHHRRPQLPPTLPPAWGRHRCQKVTRGQGCMSSHLHSGDATFIPLPHLQHDISLKSGWKSSHPEAGSSRLPQITKAAGHHMSCFETRALWRNTSVVLTPQRCYRETEALPCFTPQTSLSSLNRFSNSLVPFGICVINPHCPRNSQICFLSRASLSNTQKQVSAVLGKTSVTHGEEPQKRASPKPPNLCNGCRHITLPTQIPFTA